jgi:L-2,4-diaminobutyric acid acetyltransferase
MVATEDEGGQRLSVGPPRRGDGARMWEVARAAGELDVNTSYAYVLWARDFSATTAVARDGERVAAYCTGYLRPDEPETYFVWQVAVDPDYRRRGLGLALLDELVTRTGARALEATVTPGNDASRRLFAAFAASRGAELRSTPLFAASDFPDEHEPEDLLRLAPF